MTKEQHKKIISAIFFIIGLLNVAGWIAIGGWYQGEWMLLIYSIVFVLAGWSIHNETPQAKTFGIIAAIISIPSFPIGTIIGIYTLWYFLQAENRIE